MIFEEIRIKDIRSILHYSPTMTKWRADHRKAHFIGIQLSGAARHTFAEQSFVLSRNCVYFFNQKDDYEVEVLEPCEAFSVHFTTYEEIETDSFCVPMENPEEFISLLRKAELFKRSADEGGLSLMSAMYTLCDLLARARHRAYFPRDQRIMSAKNHIDSNFKSRECLSEAIARSGLSARRFQDLFRGMFGVTPNRYLVLRRIEEAKPMLETKSLTVTEIAERCGFSDVYYFSKVFKEICGVPPSKWK